MSNKRFRSGYRFVAMVSLSHRRPAISFAGLWNWIDAGVRQLATTAIFLVSNTVDKIEFPYCAYQQEVLSVCVSMCGQEGGEEKGGESTASSSKVGWILFRMELLLPVFAYVSVYTQETDRQRETGRNGGDETWSFSSLMLRRLFREKKEPGAGRAKG